MQCVGFLLGILASFVSWFALSRIIRPKLIISQKISKLPSEIEEGYRYRIKVVNSSRYPAYDIIMQARLIVLGLVAENPDIERRFNLSVGAGTTVYIPAKGSRQFIIKLPNPKNAAKSKLKSVYCKQYGKMDNNDTVFNIEEALSVGLKARIDVDIVCAHEFSGSRRVFTQSYTEKDILTDMMFAKNGVELESVLVHFEDLQDDGNDE